MNYFMGIGPNPHIYSLFINLINKNKLNNLFKIFNLISNLIIRTNFIITIYNKKIIKI